MNAVKVGLIGCGNVSGAYLLHLRQSLYVELVSVCDTVRERAQKRAIEHGIPHVFDHIGEMLNGPEFDLLINTTSMQMHAEINEKALNTGKHVLCEKPIATTFERGKALLDLAQRENLNLWAAPNVVTSPQFRYMAEIMACGAIGRVHAAHACYGHAGPSWGPWFYRKGGGSLFDLGVYNITTLTALLGPAKAVIAFSGIAIQERQVEGQSIEVEADDNTMLLIEHGNCVYSHVQTGFTYRHQNEDRTIELIGTKGAMNLLGFDWAPEGVQLWTENEPEWRTVCTKSGDYRWQGGGTYLAQCLATEQKSLMTGEHAVHVLEVMEAALTSARIGQRIPITSTFDWPLRWI